MLAHQAACAHEAALRFLDRSLRHDDTTEAARLANVAARLMSGFQDGLLALQRIRAGGAQTVVVQHQHVYVADGGQAVVANVAPRGRKGRL